MNVKDLQDYLSRFKPDDAVTFIVVDIDGFSQKATDADLSFGNSPVIKIEP